MRGAGRNPLFKPVDRRPFVFVNIFHLSGPKPGYTTGGSGRGGARRGGGAGPGRAGRDADGSLRLGGNRPSCLQGIVDNCPERLFRSTNTVNSIFRIQNPDTPRADRVGRRTAGRLGAAGLAEWYADRFVRAGHNCPSCPLGHRRQLFLNISSEAQTREFLPIESKTRTYHGRVGSGRTAGWRGGVGQDWVPTEMFAQETSLPRTLQSIEETSLERLSRSTNKRNPM